MKTLIGVKRQKENMTDLKRIILLTNAVQQAKQRLLKLNKYEKSTKLIEELDKILNMVL